MGTKDNAVADTQNIRNSGDLSLGFSCRRASTRDRRKDKRAKNRGGASVPWTPQMVSDRMEEAANTLRALRVPGVRPLEYGSNWPDVIHDAMDAYGWHDAELKPLEPRPEAIARMDEALEWLAFLNTPEDVHLVWARAERIPWKVLMRKFCLSRSGLTYRLNLALNEISRRIRT